MTLTHSLKTTAHPHTFNSIERLPWIEVTALQTRRLAEQMAYLEKNSLFYQGKLAEAGLSFSAIRGLEDLACVPFTVKQELRDSLKAQAPLGLHRAAPMESIVQMQASSGTTGSPSYVGLTAQDRESWTEITARALYASGIRPGDIVLHAFSMSKGFVGGVPIYQGVSHIGAIDLPIGADGGIDRLLIAARDTRPRCIVGTPNFLLYLGHTAPDVIGMRANELGVEHLIVGGEPGGGIPAIRDELERLWGARCCEVMGGTDLGCTYWAEDKDQRGMYFVGPDYILAELVDPGSGRVLPWEEGAIGELVYTSLARQASPVLRFRSGDHVRVTAIGSAKGRTAPAIRCFGRTDDMLIVRGVNLFPSAVQDLISSMKPAVGGVVRVLADFEGHSTQGNLKLLVERSPDKSQDTDVAIAQMVETHVRNALAVKTEVTLVEHGFFDAPGAQKVSLTLRQAPDLARKINNKA